jgi:dienelactone hydrolase
MRRRGLAAAAVLAFALLAAAPAWGESVAGPQGEEQGRYRRQLWLVPSTHAGLMMATTVFRPQGEGPFPLVVINHGPIRRLAVRLKAPPPTYGAISEWFVERGFAVAVPQRPGHGRTGGPYLEDGGGCGNPDFFRSGLATAASIEAAIRYMSEQDFIAKKPAIVVGQSAGGWGVLALASRNPENVKAAINFAGGRGGRSKGKPTANCKPDRLIAATETFGTTARIPTLWLYTENDSFFGPWLSQRMAEAYRKAGAPIDFHLLPAFGQDGHRFMGSRGAVAIWAPIVEKFLERVK